MPTNARNVNQANADTLEPLLADICADGLASMEDARDFFLFIEAPPHLHGLVEVCKNLVTILPLVETIVSLEIAPDHELLRKIFRWQDLAARLAEGAWSELGTGSLHGEYRGAHALYVALWYRNENLILKSRYDLLAAHICYAAHILRKIKVTDKDYVSSRNNALCRLRQLANTANAQALAKFPAEPVSLSDYYESLDKKVDDFKEKIWKLLDYAVKRKPAIIHEGVTRSRSRQEMPSVISGEPIIFHEIDDFSDRAELEVVPLIQPPSEELQKAVVKTLASPVEFSPGPETAQLDAKGRIPTPREDALTARKLAKRLAIDNQLLSARWRVLTVHEVACFLEAVDRLARDENSPPVAGVPPRELAAFLTCMFWTSSSVETVCGFKIYGKMPCERQGKGYLVSGQRAWVVNPPRPVGYDKAEKPHFHAVASDDLFLLPVPGPASRIVERYLADRPKHPEQQGNMFRDKVDYGKAVTTFLRRVKHPTRLRLTECRIADYLFESILHQPGSDIVTAMLAVERRPFLGLVPLHYTSISIRELQQRYGDACREILAGTAAELGLYGQDVGTSDQSDAICNACGRVGSRYCPRPKTVRTLVTDLKQLLLDARDAPMTTKNLLILHNRMVVYTTVMVGFATGYRAVTDPFLRQAFIDPVTGFAVISDKDTIDCYHSRIIWVPPMVRKQLDLYHRHLEAFGRQLLILNRTVFFEIRERLAEAATRPMLFMLKPNLKSTTVSKGSLENICARHLNYKLPANANRHYLRTRLLQRGCPRDVIHSFMGHWDTGTEPWGRFSTLSPPAYRESLERFLLPVLKKDGWLAVAGLGGEE